MFQKPPATTDTPSPAKGGTEGGMRMAIERERIKRCELMSRNKRDVSQVENKEREKRKVAQARCFFSFSSS